MTKPSLRLAAALAVAGTLASPLAFAADYTIDPGHSFIQFRIKHLGYSWLMGRFNDLEGSFSYDADNPSTNRIDVDVKTASIDSNHAKRDKHLRSEDFLNVDTHPLSTFRSTGFESTADGGTVTGDLTVHGVTRSISFDVRKLGEGKDPWGGYRAGFEGEYVMTRTDFGMEYNLGPQSDAMTLELFVEGIRDK